MSKIAFLGSCLLLVVGASQSVNADSPTEEESLKRAPATEWARSVLAGTDNSIFNSVAVDRTASGNIYAAGSVSGGDNYQFGPGVSVKSTAQKPAVRGSNIQPTRDIPATTAVLLMFDREGVARWAVWPGSGSTADSIFSRVALDDSGNVVVSGGIGGVENYDYGNGVMLRGSRAYRYSAALVKYSREGKAQWARSISGPSSSFFSSVAVDASQDIYVIGYCEGTGVFDFGERVSVTVTTSGPPPEFGELTTPILAKYDSNGKALWARCARTVETSSLQSRVDFNGLAIDARGDVYVAGMLLANGSYDFGNGVSLITSSTGGLLLAKYDSDGKALWAITNQVPADQDSNKWRDITVLQAVALGLQGDVVVVGSVIPDGRGKGNRRLDFGHGVSATFAGHQPALIASYGADGTPRWAKTVGDNDAALRYTSVVGAPGGQFYVSGSITGTEATKFTLGDNVEVSLKPMGDAILVDYTPDGKVAWAKSANSGGYSSYASVATDGAGNIFALGSLMRNDIYDFGNGVSVAGTADATMGGMVELSNFVLTKYHIDHFPLRDEDFAGKEFVFNAYFDDLLNPGFRFAFKADRTFYLEVPELDDSKIENGTFINRVVSEPYSVEQDGKFTYAVTRTGKYLVLYDGNEVCLVIDSKTKDSFWGLGSQSNHVVLYPNDERRNLIGIAGANSDTQETSSFLTETIRGKTVKYDGKGKYYFDLAPWAVKGNGIGQWIQKEISYSTKEVVIVNGFVAADRPDLFEKNSRVSKVEIECNAGTWNFDLTDTPNPQIVKLPAEVTGSIKFTVRGIYPGSKYEDTVISAIYFLR